MKRNTRTHRVLLIFRLIRFLTDDFKYGNGNSDPRRPAHIYVPPFLSGYEARQTALAGSIVIPFDVFFETQRHPRQKPKAAQSAGIRHAFLLKAPSSSSNSAGASCGSVSMTRLV